MILMNDLVGRPRLPVLAREVVAHTVAHPVLSSSLAIVCLAAQLGVLGTVGRTVALETDVLSSVDAAGTRGIVVSDPSGRGGIPRTAVQRVLGLPDVETALGLGPLNDASNPSVGDDSVPTPVQFYVGDLSALGVDVRGRLPGPGEAIVGSDAAETAGFIDGVGSLETGSGSRLGVVGTFEASTVLPSLNGVALTLPPQSDEMLRTISIIVVSPERVAAVASVLPAILGAADPREILTETSEEVARIRAAVEGDLGDYSRHVLLGVVAASLFINIVLVTSFMIQSRRDFGRRRALGATRSTLISLVLGQVFLATALGTVLGSAGALAAGPESMPPLDFVLATAILTVTVAVAAAFPPALGAAFKDPVVVLRTP